LLAYCCYQTLNDRGFNTSIKKIGSVTGFSVDEISKMQDKNSVITFDIHNELEKYCKMLNLSFNDYSLIKSKLPNKQSSGHNPLTLISAAIYLFCFEEKKNISLSLICSVTGISKISVNRYINSINKNAISPRTLHAKRPWNRLSLFRFISEV